MYKISCICRCVAFVVVLLSGFAGGSVYGAIKITQDDVDEQVSYLNELLSDRENLTATRRAVIGKLTRNAYDKPTVEAMRTVSRAYVGYNTDSAIVFLERAMRLATRNSGESEVLKAEMASLLPLEGRVSRAERIFASVDTTSMNEVQLMEYYAAAMYLYHNTWQLYFRFPAEEKRCQRLEAEYRRKMLACTPLEMRSGPVYLLALGDETYALGDLQKAEALLDELYGTDELGPTFGSRASVLLSQVMEKRGDRLAQEYYLLSAAVTDVKAGDVDVASLFGVGKMMLESGRERLASKYFEAAVYDEGDNHDMLSIVNTGRYAPMVVSSFEDSLSKTKAMVYVLAVLLVIAVGALCVVVYMSMRYRFSARRTRGAMGSVMSAQNGYLCSFVELCTVYVSRMTQYATRIEAKIRAGKADEVARNIRSGSFINEQIGGFFNVFDKAFLNLYPDFVASVNKLMQPEYRLSVEEEGVLNKDLRILAFMRLGLNDTAQIAQIMGYSVNTVYAYRTRLRNHAINKDTFEDDLQSISIRMD